MNKISIKSDPKNLKEIRCFIRSTAESSGFCKEDTDAIVLAVDEACTNIIRHAYNCDCTKDIIITTQTEKDKLTITLQDFGEKPDFSRLENPPKEKLRKGRYGVVFIKKIMDKAEYDTSSEQGTVLKLVKYKK